MSTAMLHNFLSDEDGATLVEYGLMVGLIAVACIIVVLALGQSIGENIDTTNTAINDAGPNQVPIGGNVP